MEMERSRNRDVFLNFGLIVYGPLGEIEKLQEIVDKECPKLNVVYQTVTAKRLFLGKRSGIDLGKEERRDYGKNEGRKSREDRQVEEASRTH